MIYNQSYREIKREYEQDRQMANRLLNQRKQEVYDKSPRLKELDDFLVKAGISASRLVIFDEENVENNLEDFKKQVKEINKEKSKIISELGYDEKYFKDVFKCNECQDTGYVENEKCKCFNQKLIEKYYDIANVNQIVEKENFDTFDFRYYSDTKDNASGVSPKKNMEMIYEKGMEFINSFGKEFQNIIFYGDAGIGKTFMCNCIAKEMLDKGRTVLYVTAPQLFKKVEEYRFNRDEMEHSTEQIEMIYSVDLLIIDDLGSEFATRVTNTELFNILNTRMLESKPTIISTNLSMNDLQSSYSDRIVSRLTGNYKVFRFFGEDIRVKKKLGN